MKKVIEVIILSILLIITIYVPVKAVEEGTTQLRLTVVEADEPYEIYMLLPKNYINYAIQHDGLDIGYDSANTLIYNTIPSIVVNVNNVLTDTYIDNGIEYVQIKLDDMGGEEYVFEIISEYTDMDMMYRIKSQSKDNLMLIDNFTVEDNMCKMEYNYKQDTIQSQKGAELKIGFELHWWQILIIIVLIIFLIYLHNRRNY